MTQPENKRQPSGPSVAGENSRQVLQTIRLLEEQGLISTGPVVPLALQESIMRELGLGHLTRQQALILELVYVNCKAEPDGKFGEILVGMLQGEEA